MRSYRPGSWSELARKMADRQIAQCLYYTTEYVPSEETILHDTEWLKNVRDVNHYLAFFSKSYRHPLIRRRALKRFVRVMKKKGIM